MITAEILPVSITIDISTKTLDISTGTQIAHDYAPIPSNYGKITWNGSFLMVS